MFFRFFSAIALVVAISLAGTGLEKQSLELRRRVSHQHYQMDALYDMHARLRLRTQELGAPIRLFAPVEQGELALQRPKESATADRPAMPMLRWQSSAPPTW